MLYCVANNLFYVIIEISDPVTAQVFGSLEIVIVGLFSVLILRKRYAVRPLMPLSGT